MDRPKIICPQSFNMGQINEKGKEVKSMKYILRMLFLIYKYITCMD
jgi:hypothetical protein